MANQQSSSKPFSVYRLRIPPQMVSSTSSSSIETTISASILAVTSAVAVVLPLVPYEKIGQNSVPTIIFKGLPATFHGFVISIMFAFSGAFSALLVPNKPKISRLCRFYSMVSMASAVAFLMSANFSQSIEA
ncbi:hypothetical protein ACSBR1_006495 [Camellia fascicularis]